MKRHSTSLDDVLTAAFEVEGPLHSRMQRVEGLVIERAARFRCCEPRTLVLCRKPGLHVVVFNGIHCPCEKTKGHVVNTPHLSPCPCFVCGAPMRYSPNGVYCCPCGVVWGLNLYLSLEERAAQCPQCDGWTYVDGGCSPCNANIELKGRETEVTFDPF